MNFQTTEKISPRSLSNPVPNTLKRGGGGWGGKGKWEGEFAGGKISVGVHRNVRGGID